jgi:hypothetical protein
VLLGLLISSGLWPINYSQGRGCDFTSEEGGAKEKKGGIAPATGGDWDGMDGAKPPPAAGGKQELEEALLHIVQQHHHHQSFRQRQQTGTPLCSVPTDSLDFDYANSHLSLLL